jgi:hypothetical protein
MALSRLPVKLPKTSPSSTSPETGGRFSGLHAGHIHGQWLGVFLRTRALQPRQGLELSSCIVEAGGRDGRPAPASLAHAGDGTGELLREGEHGETLCPRKVPNLIAVGAVDIHANWLTRIEASRRGAFKVTSTPGARPKESEVFSLWSWSSDLPNQGPDQILFIGVEHGSPSYFSSSLAAVAGHARRRRAHHLRRW